MERRAGDNYEEVNMDMSDSESSDNEMFANKKEYEAFKQHFSSKASGNTAPSTGPTGEYGGPPEEDPSSEYGGGSDRISVVSSKLSSEAGAVAQKPVGRERSSMAAGEKKVERKPMLYGDSKKEKSPGRDRHRSRSRGRRSSSRSDDRERRSRSRDDRRRRSRSRSKTRRRSRSPNRDGGRQRDRGGWGRDRGRDRRREREEEGVKNHEDQLKRAKEMGVEMPKYIKPGSVNPLSYASQMQKRKQLWAKPASSGPAPGSGVSEVKSSEEVSSTPAPAKPAGGSYNNWESTNFGNDKANEKFRRLMGIKAGATDSSKTASSGGSHNEVSYNKIMNDLDRNYEAARQQTHRNRGIGLGFSDGGQYQAQPPVVGQPPPPPPGTGWQNRNSAGINFVRKQ